jgi:hypothetical protein
MRNISMGFVASLLLAGCAQGEGDRCQLTSDCESGLECKMEVCTGKKTVVLQPDGAVFTQDAAMVAVDAHTVISSIDSGAADAQTLQSVDTAVLPAPTVDALPIDAASKTDAQE